MDFYLSRLLLDPDQGRATHQLDRALSGPRGLHCLIASGFGEEGYQRERTENSGFLYRKEPEPEDGCVEVLVQSCTEPNWSQGEAGQVLPRQGQANVRAVTLSRREGEVFRFRLRANPTYRISNRGAAPSPAGKPGARVSIANNGPRREAAGVEVAALLSRAGEARAPAAAEINLHLFTGWLVRRLGEAGAELLPCEAGHDPLRPYRLNVVDEGLVRASRGLQFQSVLFDGFLRVREPDALLKAVKQGIGTGKAWGCGLLSLART